MEMALTSHAQYHGFMQTQPSLCSKTLTVNNDTRNDSLHVGTNRKPEGDMQPPVIGNPYISFHFNG